MVTDDRGFIDEAAGQSRAKDSQARGLAGCRSWSAWVLTALQGQVIGLKVEPVLRDLGTRGDIIKTNALGLHRTRSGSWHRRRQGSPLADSQQRP
jgi:hypothetical protein